jgi:hypothetical protein
MNISNYQHLPSLVFVLWTEAVSLTTRIAQRILRVSSKLPLRLYLKVNTKVNTWRDYLSGLSDSSDSKANLESNFENDIEGAPGTYTDPLSKNPSLNMKLVSSPSFITKSEINHKWTQTLRKSGAITESKEVHTLQYQWHKGISMNEKQAIEVLKYLGISASKRGFSDRRKIVSSLLYAFMSCSESINFETPIVGLSFPATTQGGIKSTQGFCRGASYSAKTVTSILLKLARGDWIMKRAGFRGKGSFSGVTTIWTPAEKLVGYMSQLFDEVRLDSYRDKHANVELREPSDDRTEHLDITFVKELSNEVSSAEKLLKSVSWAYMEEGRWLDLQPVELELTRKFKFDYNSGGRLYCIAQNLPKVTRRTLTVNGNPTVELDFKSLHPTMLYHFAGLDAPEDCYLIPNAKRENIKQVLLTALNAKTRQGAKQSVVNTLEVKHDEAERLMKACEVLHEPISQHFYCSSWRRLQYLDGSITMDTLSDLASHGIPALPIHDSYIVEVKHEGRLKDAMSRAYQNRVDNYMPRIE